MSRPTFVTPQCQQQNQIIVPAMKNDHRLVFGFIRWCSECRKLVKPEDCSHHLYSCHSTRHIFAKLSHLINALLWLLVRQTTDLWNQPVWKSQQFKTASHQQYKNAHRYVLQCLYFLFCWKCLKEGICWKQLILLMQCQKKTLRKYWIGWVATKKRVSVSVPYHKFYHSYFSETTS